VTTHLHVRTLDDLRPSRAGGIDRAAVTAVREIVDDVRREGDRALRRWAMHFGELKAHEPVFLDRHAIESALDRIGPEAVERLQRVAGRIRGFAEAQRAAARDHEVAISGGAAGSRFVPVERAGCYTPGGRYPLPSSALMTVIPAAVAGVEEIWVASPKPSWETLASAAIAGADGVVAAGGAQAIAALAYGAGPVRPSDVVVGPGNAYVTAAKQLVTERVAIDMLAGPSELAVVADDSADPDLVAADLLAQAEHDPQAMPVLITTDRTLADAVDIAIGEQLATLPTADIARAALGNGGAIVVSGLEEAVAASDALAPEHLELHVADPKALQSRLTHYGALFVGAGAAEVLGDYGAGPNHVLPTGGTARSVGGPSVCTCLRSQTWLRIDDLSEARELVHDAVWLGRVEGLEGHARAAERRVKREP
jgi:phosphoribosyl-ATP pyrophosphohydrolase/phosphoribosyl-AMP cyclohydrolase/histidinol dehydrogenase